MFFKEPEEKKSVRYFKEPEEKKSVRSPGTTDIHHGTGTVHATGYRLVYLVQQWREQNKVDLFLV